MSGLSVLHEAAISPTAAIRALAQTKVEKLLAKWAAELPAWIKEGNFLAYSAMPMQNLSPFSPLTKASVTVTVDYKYHEAASHRLQKGESISELGALALKPITYNDVHIHMVIHGLSGGIVQCSCGVDPVSGFAKQFSHQFEGSISAMHFEDFEAALKKLEGHNPLTDAYLTRKTTLPG